ncbi:MAG: CDF family Co(II)/Ni(II) efflux transporter DmeF [Planctomycetes bacterium]|nr:CDF family Co(II)/Ni(II) efflux transporter DmeF [Planctomycetota bacterium]
MELHAKTVDKFSHNHDLGSVSSGAEKRTLFVVLLTAATMIVEIVFGTITGSMALLADGWHMGTHALALSISFVAYFLARRLSGSDRFSFGTGKFGVLGGYTSALFLAVAALWMMYESVTRIISPIAIAFDEAILVTTIGLIVNLISVAILHSGGHSHEHEDHEHEDHEHEGHEHEDRQDHNYRAAYLHVIADALTSVLALGALLTGRYLGWTFMDPVMGIVGGLLILRWSYGLIKVTSRILLDENAGAELRQKIRDAIELGDESKIADLHVWRVSSRDFAVIVSVVSSKDVAPEEFKKRICLIPHLSHVSVEVNVCEDALCECTSDVV